MRRLLITFAALLATASISGHTTSAKAESYPVCLTGGNNNALRCDYTNVEQCDAAASGGLGYCVIDPDLLSNSTYASHDHAGKRKRTH
ncbi:DUF3551 domain-containing protein [Bradyrhizobium elkanii]|uniref:DUF3551 domain-containing protein n=1 Tax=Bradyrhizobium elkanii TaxID=29448 RepID=UPI0018AD4306